MNKYNWRKRFRKTISNDKLSLDGKIAFKTEETDWEGTALPAIVPISIHSSFHEGIEGALKMEALLSVLSESTSGSVTLLMTDRAHLQVASLIYGNNVNLALEMCLQDSNSLKERFRSLFRPYPVVSWAQYISADPFAPQFQKKIQGLATADPIFSNLLTIDAASTYTPDRQKEFSDRELFMEKAKEDLIEQCMCILVLAQKGYRYMFYPGEQFSSVKYVNETLLGEGERISMIHVFLSFEKKKLISL